MRLSIVLSAVLALVVQARVVTFDNTHPRCDVNGNIMDAHDGTIQKFTFNGTSLYYMHAMSYGLCKEPAGQGCDGTPDNCGWRQDHNISIWSSPNMSNGSWTYVGNSINVTARPAGVVFRPHLIYNANTKLYVLFWNYATNGNFLAAATAPSPAGPFTLQQKAVNISSGECGDFAVFLDDDGTAYVIYSWQYYMYIERLTRDFLHSETSKPYVFTEYFVEAPAMFKRQGIYYVLFGYCCCYCMQGSGVMVHMATNPMGPYTKLAGDLACVPSNVTNSTSSTTIVHGTPTPDNGCQYLNPNTTSIVRSQQNFIVQADTPHGIEYIWTGDRWQQAPDGIKGHEPQYWAPLRFHNQYIQNMTWVDWFTVDII